MKYSQADYYGDSKLNFVSFYNKFKDAKKKKNGWESFLHQISQNCVKTQRGEMTFNFFKISE